MDRIKPVIPDSAWIAETATVLGEVILGDEVSVWPSAVIRGDEAPISIGDRTNIQDGVVVHVTAGTPCTIGKDVTVGHSAVVHSCTVEDGALIGIGAIVLDGAKVGAGAMVAAGALVPPGMEIPPESLAVGVPAKVRGQLADRHNKSIKEGLAHYLLRKEEYREGKY